MDAGNRLQRVVPECSRLTIYLWKEYNTRYNILSYSIDFTVEAKGLHSVLQVYRSCTEVEPYTLYLRPLYLVKNNLLTRDLEKATSVKDPNPVA